MPHHIFQKLRSPKRIFTIKIRKSSESNQSSPQMCPLKQLCAPNHGCRGYKVIEPGMLAKCRDLRASTHVGEMSRFTHFAGPEVYISSHVGTRVTTNIFFLLQKYSNQGILCKYIQIRVFCAELLVRYRYAFASHARLTTWIGPNKTRP